VRIRLRGPVAGAVLPVFLAGAPAAAQERPNIHELRWDPALDVTVTLGGGAIWMSSELLKDYLAPSACHWCNVDSLDDRVRTSLIWRDTASADAISSVTGFVLVPLASVGLDALAAAHDGALRKVPEDALLVVEAGVVAANVNQLIKMLVGRERPFVHALATDDKPKTAQPSDNNLSFISGHTTEAFALAAASGTIGAMRGYRWAPLAWGVGGALAATTAYLRIAADRHWLTDVVVGALVGAGVGFAIPYVFHSAVDDSRAASSSAALRAPSVPASTAITIAW
jgi:membrane-associated phospholipid phosphatase